jgi:hypothetical protein
MHPWDIGRPVNIYEARVASIFLDYPEVGGRTFVRIVGT